MNRALVAGSALTLLVGGALFTHGTAMAHKPMALVGVGLIMLGLVLLMKPVLDLCEVFDQAIDTDTEPTEEDGPKDLSETLVLSEVD